MTWDAARARRLRVVPEAHQAQQTLASFREATAASPRLKWSSSGSRLGARHYADIYRHRAKLASERQAGQPLLLDRVASELEAAGDAPLALVLAQLDLRHFVFFVAEGDELVAAFEGTDPEEPSTSHRSSGAG